MRFFTRELHRQVGSEDEYEVGLTSLRAATAGYLEHLSRIARRLPERVAAIAHPFHVDDALIAKLRHCKDEKTLYLVLRRGNIPDGYDDLALAYKDVRFGIGSEELLHRIAETTLSARRFAYDAWCHEVDLMPDGRLYHQLLFNCRDEAYPHDEVAIVQISAKHLLVESYPRPDRELPPLDDRSR